MDPTQTSILMEKKVCLAFLFLELRQEIAGIVSDTTFQWVLLV